MRIPRNPKILDPPCCKGGTQSGGGPGGGGGGGGCGGASAGGGAWAPRQRLDQALQQAQVGQLQIHGQRPQASPQE
eukprot:6842970-Pyramimonas_sp.AAC.2